MDLRLRACRSQMPLSPGGVRPRQGSGLSGVEVWGVRPAGEAAVSHDLDQALDGLEQAAAAGAELAHHLGRGS